MKPATLEQLIEKYFAGETTRQEERQLREWLQKADLPESLQDLKAQFMMMDALAREELPADFDERLMQDIRSKGQHRENLFMQMWIPAVAATVLILVAILFGTDLLPSRETPGNISDPKMAFMETRKVLEDVSKKMNEGLTPAKTTVDKVETNIQKAAEMQQMNNALEKAKNVEKINQASDLLKSLNKVYIRIGNS